VHRDERTAAIKREVEQHEKAVKDHSAVRRTERLWCKDEWRDFPVYRVPTGALLLNIDNRRFAAERVQYERMIDHALDPENNPNDEKSVISILLDSNPSVDGDILKGSERRDSEALRSDWSKRKQQSPFWIRPDGTVRNGNRRLAMLRRMAASEGSTGTEYVDAVIFDEQDVDEQELFDMEQREQLTENFKVRYTDINLLITLREAAEALEIDWLDDDDIERVAGEIQDRVEGGKQYATIQLRAVRYMDAYLEDIGAAGQYYKLIGQIERFRDVGKTMMKLTDHPDDIADFLRLQFAGIKAGVKHGQVRSVGKLFQKDRDEYRRLRDKVFHIEDANQNTTELGDPDPATLNEVDASDEGDEPPSTVVGFPIDKVKAAVTNAIDAYDVKTLDVSSTLEQAASRLRVVSPEKVKQAAAGEDKQNIDVALQEIFSWVDAMRAKSE
jgi:hypothetical protein